MQASMYSMSVPIFAKLLGNLGNILDKGAAFAEQKKIEPSVLLNARLAPDMLPLLMQVRIACDFARGGAARLAGDEPPQYEATETGLADLRKRVDNAIAYVRTFGPERFAGAEDRVIVRPIGGKEYTFNGHSYLAEFVLPNFYFHITTAYDILRHNGVELGKRDFVGAI